MNHEHNSLKEYKSKLALTFNFSMIKDSCVDEILIIMMWGWVVLLEVSFIKSNNYFSNYLQKVPHYKIKWQGINFKTFYHFKEKELHRKDLQCTLFTS